MNSFGIIPAAGRSKRMGSPKLLLPWRGKTVIEQVVAAWRASRVSRVVVVVRPDDTELAGLVRRLDVDLIVPDVPPPEMKDSVCLALAHVERRYAPSSEDAWLLAPADMPGLSTAVIDMLLAEHAHTSPPPILIPTHGERRGHPVLFPWCLAGEAASLSADEGLNALVARHPVRLVPCAEPAVLDDLDTPDDYRRLQESSKARAEAGIHPR